MALAEYGILLNGDLMVTCWCEDKTVIVTPKELKAGLTKSCGRPRCVAA